MFSLSRNLSRSLLPSLLLLALWGALPQGGAGAWAAPPAAAEPFAVAASTLEAPGTLKDQHGKSLALHDLAGRAVLVTFGYTHCPDVCPITFALLARTHARLGALGERLAVLFVTLDPARDTPALLGQYVGHFNPGFLGLTGSRAEVDAFAKAFGARYRIRQKPGDPNYAVDHTAFTYLLDPQGRLRYRFTLDVEAPTLEAAVRYVLQPAP